VIAQCLFLTMRRLAQPETLRCFGLDKENKLTIVNRQECPRMGLILDKWLPATPSS
jgi:hypothetical protein